MLVLTRNVGEEVFIGDDIRIMIVDVQSGKQVKLGITALPSVEIHRREIYEDRMRERNAET